MSPEDDGLLGGLPRSRPGTRSSRREQADTPARKEPPPPVPATERERRDGDPVGDAVRAAARTAEAGLKVAQQVTLEVFRRLPRL